MRAAIWPEAPEPIDEEAPGSGHPLPAAFLWALYDQKANSLTVALDLSVPTPPEWSLYLPGERADDAPPLVDQSSAPSLPPDGRLVIALPPPGALAGAQYLRAGMVWRDEAGEQTGLLPVHIKSMDDLLPPEEFRSLTAQAILDCLLSGQEPAEWVDALERKREHDPDSAAARQADALRAVDTGSYLLYRTRRLGIALTAMGERLFNTVRSSNAMTYRLRHDPLGPLMLTETLVREWREEARSDPSRWRDQPDVQPCRDQSDARPCRSPDRRGAAAQHLRRSHRRNRRAVGVVAASHAPPPNLQQYLHDVRRRQTELLQGGG